MFCAGGPSEHELRLKGPTCVAQVVHLNMSLRLKGPTCVVQVVHLDCETARDEPTLLDKERWNMRQALIIIIYNLNLSIERMNTNTKMPS